MKKTITIIATLAICSITFAKTTVTVKDTVCTTYGFSDPNPVPQPDKLYPYFTFQRFDFKSSQKTWKMVILENDYIRVRIFPEIGGKIWSVYDKTRGEELFYDNDVIKFREISLRGPWTSGGIEFNYGIIGHAPSCAHPVDFKTIENSDGSASCFIGVSELLSQSRWCVEINLPSDAVWVRTSSFWHNGSGDFQPYYTWVNSGVTASEDLELIYPASYYIGHDGSIDSFPIDPEGHDLRKYSDQKFGTDKSYHAGGSHKGFFGAYWADSDFGMLHYALRDEKLGRKYFSWAQSPQGDIWRDILTDNNPQYIELQSGRLFNQNLPESIYTPYKQFLFTPYGTDCWNEYWMPFGKIGGSPDEVNLRAAVRVERNVNAVKVGIYAMQALCGELRLLDEKGVTVASVKDFVLNPSESYNGSFAVNVVQSIMVDGRRIWSADEQKSLRPTANNEDFDLGSAQGNMLFARYAAGMRNWALAKEKVDAALALDPSLVEALELKSMLLYREMRYQEALKYADAALSVDEYDPMANYLGGVAAERLALKYEAMDRFEVAALTSELRSASCTRLAEIHFADGDKELAAEYARKSLVGNAYNVTALQILYQACPDEAILESIEAMDPLCHFPAIERTLDGRMTPEALYESIFEELKEQNYLEYAVFYNNLGLKDKALALLQACPVDNALIALWKAWLNGDSAAIASAQSKSIDFVFPFRREDETVLEWACENGDNWRTRYLLATTKDFLGDKKTAAELLSGNDADYAPYYAYRYNLLGDRSDILKAIKLDPSQWRYRQTLALDQYASGEYKAAAQTAQRAYSKDKENFHLGDTYVKSLMACGQYVKADKVLCAMQILPFEGQTGSHVMYRDIKLHLAAAAIDAGDYNAALKHIDAARLWPANLGVGKPYDQLIDSGKEDWLESVARERMADPGKEYDKVTPLLDGPVNTNDKKLF